MNYRNWLAVTTVVISTVTLTACAQNSAAQNDALQNASNATKTSSTHQHADSETHDGETHDGESHGAHDETAHGSSVHTHSTKLNYSSEPATILPGKPATMTLQIVDKKTGAPINDFEVVHDKKLHFIVVSSDLQFFNHIHPQFVGDGKFQIETTLPRTGGYRLYADYKPQGEEGEVALQEITVGGASTATSSTRLTPDVLRNGWMVKNTASHDEGVEPAANAARYQVALMPMPSKIEAGKDVMLHFQVRDAAGKAVSKLEPYLGAQGHCVILSSDPKTYLHTHPMDASHDMGAMKTGEIKMSEGTKMSEGDDGKTAASGADVMFHTNFPSAGLYKIWGQFMHNGKIVSAPFVVNVGTKSGATKTAANTTSSTRSSVAIPANAQKITVSLPDGYKNGAAKIQAGKPVAITFKLTSNAGCGNTITVPAAKWSETLEVGQSATVVYTPTKSGALGFACGMNMMKGSIVVQ